MSEIIVTDKLRGNRVVSRTDSRVDDDVMTVCYNVTGQGVGGSQVEGSTEMPSVVFELTTSKHPVPKGRQQPQASATDQNDLGNRFAVEMAQNPEIREILSRTETGRNLAEELKRRYDLLPSGATPG